MKIPTIIALTTPVNFTVYLVGIRSYSEADDVSGLTYPLMDTTFSSPDVQKILRYFKYVNNAACVAAAYR